MSTRHVPKSVAAVAALSPLEQIETIRQGIATQLFDQLATALGLGRGALARTLNINEQTLRKRKSRVLSPSEAEKSLRVARVFAMATEVLGSEDKGRRWLNANIPALGGKRPLDLLDTDIGAAQVTNVLQAIKWGVYV
ncbi:MAG TPA: antitoxin Xre/MbcA/ParS toxin-binding domain-containing protein [Chthoniobacterales bacterium]|jgi:putative toxin-antitoxin system antitoxin component (TIGR02293 family)